MSEQSRAKSFRELTGAPRSTASPLDSTLIIVDAQNEYADGLLKTADIDRTRAAISTVLETYRAAAADPSRSNIVHVVHSVAEGAPVFTPNTDLCSEFPEIAAAADEKVIAKRFPGAFTETDLHAHLQSVPGGRGRKVVLAGYMAHVCVSTTARQAHELGYEVVICGDAVGDRDIPGARGEEVTGMVLCELADAFGTVVESRDLQID